MAAVPHPFENADGQTVCPPGVVCPNPAFLLTNDTKPEMDLLRYYPDRGRSRHRFVVLAAVPGRGRTPSS